MSSTPCLALLDCPYLDIPEWKKLTRSSKSKPKSLVLPNELQLHAEEDHSAGSKSIVA